MTYATDDRPYRMPIRSPSAERTWDDPTPRTAPPNGLADFGRELQAIASNTVSIGVLTAIFVLDLIEGTAFAAMFILCGGAAVVALRRDRLGMQSLRYAHRARAEIERLDREVWRLESTDALTALPNHQAFLDALANRLAGQASRPLAVGIFGIDNFRTVNDMSGHLVGDKLLKMLAGRLASLGDHPLFARLGGDKFGFLIEADEAAASNFGDSLCALVAEPYEIDGCRVQAGCSCGIAMYPQSGTKADSLYEHAYYALSVSKAAARGQVTFHDEDHESRMRAGYAIEFALQDCDFEHEMTVLFQPIAEVDTGRVALVEALARWTTLTLGPVPPDVFVASAERLGLIHRLTLALLRRTLREARRLPQGISVSFNLSAHDVTDPRTVLAIVALVREMGLDPRRIVFEITETAVMGGVDVAAQALHLFRAMGIRVALDDFGTGYSSLGHLHRLTLDKVKIDRSFLNQADKPEGRRLLASIVSLCAGLNFDCVVEGVETREQLAFLRQIGCEFFQGYFLARPMALEQFLRWHAAHNASIHGMATAHALIPHIPAALARAVGASHARGTPMREPC